MDGLKTALRGAGYFSRWEHRLHKSNILRKISVTDFSIEKCCILLFFFDTRSYNNQNEVVDMRHSFKAKSFRTILPIKKTFIV